MPDESEAVAVKVKTVSTGPLVGVIETFVIHGPSVSDGGVGVGGGEEEGVEVGVGVGVGFVVVMVVVPVVVPAGTLITGGMTVGDVFVDGTLEPETLGGVVVAVLVAIAVGVVVVAVGTITKVEVAVDV
jgi:hypothetical protein